MPFVNRDVIAKGLNLENPDAAALRALRIAAVRHAILKRYDRALAGLAETIPLVEQLLVFDNSIHKRAPQFLPVQKWRTSRPATQPARLGESHVRTHLRRFPPQAAR